MRRVTTVGLDLAENLLRVHGADARGRPVLRRELARGKVLEFFADPPSCLVGLEAGAAAHRWARELSKLGHEVRLVPPRYVRPYVETNEHDAADAEAVREAVTRPGMRFVPAKGEDRQASLMPHRVREQLPEQRTATANVPRAHLADSASSPPSGGGACGSCWRWSPTPGTGAWSGWPATAGRANAWPPCPGSAR